MLEPYWYNVILFHMLLYITQAKLLPIYKQLYFGIPQVEEEVST